jgi:hypothetical protein
MDACGGGTLTVLHLCFWLSITLPVVLLVNQLSAGSMGQRPSQARSMTNSSFKRGDLVVHPRRPEWGNGVVKDAQPIQHENQPAQRLTVQFANKGRVILNTAIAPLALKGLTQTMARSISSSPRSAGSATSASAGWLDQLERSSNGHAHELWELPEAMTDPFASLTRRLEATLETYRFSTEPRSLIDWAVAQTGLSDPLSKYTRHELEQAFPRFARDRDQHLQSLVRTLKRNNQRQLLNQVLAGTRLPAARSALDKAIRN